jgi:pyruvate dehydrogenase E1 component alpha subunit
VISEIDASVRAAEAAPYEPVTDLLRFVTSTPRRAT